MISGALWFVTDFTIKCRECRSVRVCRGGRVLVWNSRGNHGGYIDPPPRDPYTPPSQAPPGPMSGL